MDHSRSHAPTSAMTSSDAAAALALLPDGSKTREQLLDELAALRHRVGTLETLVAERKAIETELEEARRRLQYLLAASPAVIYTTQASGDFACTFVSENLTSTMGYAPWEMREDTKFWSKRVHPDDADRVFGELSSLIGRGGGTLEYRFRHRRGHYI